MERDKGERLKGILFLILSATGFAFVDGLSKILSETQTVGQIIWARYGLALPLLLLVIGPSGWSGLFRTRRPLEQVARGLMPLGVSATMVLAVRYLPLAEATVILFASPFLVVSLSWPLLGERVRPASWVAVGVGFLAVLLVMRPGFGTLSHYVVFPLAAATIFAFYQIMTRRLAAAGERPETTLAWTLAVGALVATPLAAIFWAPASASTWGLMLALGLSFAIAQGMMVRAYHHAPAELLAPFGYAQVIAAALFGAVVIGDFPDGWTIFGIALLIGAGIFVVRTRAR